MAEAVVRLVVAAGVLVLVGCGAGGTAPSGPADPAVGASGSPEAGERVLPPSGYAVPAVSSPVAIDTLLDRPCSVLGAEDLRRLGVGRGEARTDGTCVHPAPGGDLLTGVTVAGRATGLDDLLADYRRQGDGSWEPLRLGGHPAAYVNGPFEASTGGCVLVVATAADQHLRVEAATADDSSAAAGGALACEKARMVAEAVLERLVGAGR